MSAVLPGGRDLASAELYSDPPGLSPMAEEGPFIERSVAKRRNEFITVRYCARIALGELGFPPVPILKEEGRTMLAGRRGGQSHALRGLPGRGGRS